MGKGSFVPPFRIYSQKPTSKRRFSSVSPVTIPALTYHCGLTTQGRQDPMSSTGPEVLFGLNQRPERVWIPTLYFLQERTYLRLQIHYSLFLVEQTILLCYITNKQTKSPWTWSKLRCMILGPMWPLRPFTVGFRWTKSCQLVTGKHPTHFQFFLPKRRYLIR